MLTLYVFVGQLWLLSMCFLHSGVQAEGRGRGRIPKLPPLCCIWHYHSHLEATAIIWTRLMSGVGWGEGDHPSPGMPCRSQSSMWGWLIFQGGQPIIGNDNTLSSLLSESFSYFGGMVERIPSARLFWFSNHKPEPSPRDTWGLSTKNRYHMWSVRVSCSADLVCRLQPLKLPSRQCYLW